MSGFGIYGIEATIDNKPSNGMVDGVETFDTKAGLQFDPETSNGITAPDESAKYAGNVTAWSDTNAYGSNEQAFEVARNYLFINKAGTNTIAGEDLTKKLYMQKGAGFNLYGLA